MVFAAVLSAGCGGAENQYQPPPPPEVTVASPVVRTVPVYIEENGETEAVERAEVSARVTGFLQEIEFNPADLVTEGEVLYVIEPDQYKATRDAAQAALEAAEAAILVADAQVGTLKVEEERASSDFERQKKLLEQEATTQQQYETADAAYKAAQAQVTAAEANVAAANADRNQAQEKLARAELDLSYTTVTAPISGKITKTEVKVGNLVHEGTRLATIVNRDRIYANFNVSDRELLRLQQAGIERRRAAGIEEPPDFTKFKAELHREIDTGYPFVGHLDYIDQEGVEQSTGTFAVRAIFENPDDLILPGLFVLVRVPIAEQENAVLIPEVAVSRDPQGRYVQVLDAKNKLERRYIVMGQIVQATLPEEDGESSRVVRMVVVDQGLSPDDQIVIKGGISVRPGVEVSPTETSLAGIKLIDSTPSADEAGPVDAAETSE
jgi:RND family efflux transporter MFP subunit